MAEQQFAELRRQLLDIEFARGQKLRLVGALSGAGKGRVACGGLKQRAAGFTDRAVVRVAIGQVDMVGGI
ncbi:hypothetical protein [Asticcacaulis sp.]|uniref:hypothetical protein n=1 Tax=Asticcacaulis sp. TaxID=1872648 RepID=UPI0031D65FDA